MERVLRTQLHRENLIASRDRSRIITVNLRAFVDVEAVLQAAKVAKENGSSRFCMGAAWRDMRGRKTNLRNIKEMVAGVRALGMEACVTLGMIDAAQARELKDAGLTAYNHNVDTSREH